MFSTTGVTLLKGSKYIHSVYVRFLRGLIECSICLIAPCRETAKRQMRHKRLILACFRYIIVTREPSKPYDSNAIKIENVQHEQIGHIPRNMASKLARYIDNGSLLVEGSLSGRVGTYDCPVTLQFFGTSDPVERANLRQQVKEDRLPCQMLDQAEKQAKARERERLKKLAAVKRANKGGMAVVSTGGGQQFDVGQGEWAGTSTPSDGRSLDDIMELAQAFNPRNMGKQPHTISIL